MFLYRTKFDNIVTASLNFDSNVLLSQASLEPLKSIIPSSVNLEKYEEWKNEPLFVPDLVRFLDNALSYFIENAPESVFRAKFSAASERSIGLGAMGFHAYLQSKGIPFESALAKALNLKIFKKIAEIKP